MGVEFPRQVLGHTKESDNEMTAEDTPTSTLLCSYPPCLSPHQHAYQQHSGQDVLGMIKAEKKDWIIYDHSICAVK